MCSCCTRALLEPIGWLDIEQVSFKLRLFETRKVPEIRYTVCPDCRASTSSDNETAGLIGQIRMRIREARTDDESTLLDIWLRSVRATHDFLSEEDIQFFFPLVRDHALPQLELWVLVNNQDHLMGFMGLTGQQMDALFLAPEHFRSGGGRLLVEHARKLKGPLTVDVNEQNHRARKFYEALGFIVTGRSELDGTGRPFPLLHLRDASHLDGTLGS